MAINKQTHIIHQEVLKSGGYVPIDIRLKEFKELSKDSNEVLCDYIPHGIDENKFYPITVEDPLYNEYSEFQTKFVESHKSKFIVFWNNRNIRRKQPGDVILSFKYFKDLVQETYGDDAANSCLLFMHTAPIDPNGTDLISVKNIIAPDCRIIFSTEKVSSKILNFYYNIADVTLNIASNEGFGLSNAESIMAGTLTIANVTGGLQDQMGFYHNDGSEFFPTAEFITNHKKGLLQHKHWSIPVFPTNHSLQGSIETPYIFDDRVQPESVAQALLNAYESGREDLKKRAIVGREWMINYAKMTSNQMADSMYKSIKLCIDTFKQKPKYQLTQINEKKQPQYNGVTKFKAVAD
jgi:glycosyltransferase involved in cell wall biosynthesis